jgi:hypothetical protein
MRRRVTAVTVIVVTGPVAKAEFFSISALSE